MGKLIQISSPGASYNQIEGDVAVGIDLGTTNSLACIAQDGKPEVLVDITQSVVAFRENGDIKIGKEAALLENNPSYKVISSVKSLMGSQMDLHIFGHKYTPSQISSVILSSLKHQAEQKLKRNISKVVITVPAYFDDAQRQATKDAAEIAGLEVLRLINEPTAAAYAYGLDNASEGIYAVYDLGGGTFDISILSMKMGVFKVIATKGNTRLGGDDFDNLLATKFNISKSSAKMLKECLSTEKQVEINHQVISRGQFEEIISELILSTIDLFKSALRDADLIASDIKGIILVGGATRMPIIKKALEREFARPILSDLDADRIVGFGAAIQAENLVKKRQGAGLLLDVCPLSLGIESLGGINEKIIERNSTIPITKANNFTTSVDGQSGIVLHIVQGERELVKDCRTLGIFELNNIPPMPAGVPKIVVKFHLDADGLLSVSAVEERSGASMSVQVKPTYKLETEQIFTSLEQAAEHGQADIRERLLIQTRIEARQNLDILKKALDEDGDLIGQRDLQVIQLVIQNLKNAIFSATREEIKLKLRELELVSNDFVNKRLGKKIKNSLTREHGH
jgi:molecular chaperone HscA